VGLWLQQLDHAVGQAVLADDHGEVGLVGELLDRLEFAQALAIERLVGVDHRGGGADRVDRSSICGQRCSTKQMP
jgi:hypothetical protein